MTLLEKNQLIDFLKANLTINLYVSPDRLVHVDLAIAGHKIDESEAYLPDNKNCQSF